MIWEAVSFFTLKVKPYVGRLRHISIVFFILWIVDLFLSIYCESLVLNVNAYIVFNVWVSLAGAAMLHHYSSSSLTLPEKVGTKSLQVTPRGNNRVKSRETSPLRVSVAAEITEGFCFGVNRLHVLICFGAAVFVVFGCLALIGESLHHALHPPDTSPLLLLTVGIAHVLLFTYYAAEIDAYDHISGQPRTLTALRSSFANTTNTTSSSNTRKETTVSPTGVHPAANANAARRSLWSSLQVAAARAAGPLVCVVSCLILWMGGQPLWALVAVLLLAAHTAVRAVASARAMAALLLNNVVQQPADVAACERALRAVRLTDGVLLVQSSIVWEVAPGERMALVRLRITSDADPAAVSAAARSILAGIATHVFVEARTTQDDEDDDDDENSGNDSYSSSAHHHHHSHSHSHAHSHSHVHHNGEGHDHDHDHSHEHHGECTLEMEHLTGMNEDLSSIGRSGGEVASSASIGGEMMSFPQPPKMSAADHTEQQTRLRGAAVGGNLHTTKATKSFNVVPPPFPKPPI
ncbi:uncharacterized protein TM35_000171620 [Trypanosoma theileri]|uniref:Uncharacterized protein n=1 Tax=Trypanosoma theileri TaxID=67003 RepID=A0A1X0NVY9_9TRYP|nr:uncharacterized protein TM35_000171620 [Trypanosoma theileri]ORC88290.1 hypothetical protein TM35_000171620 [Trypanosoma theileri]